jgi:hypothetical protein
MAYEERIALNEATFCELNEAIEDGRRTRNGMVGFLCECGMLGCNDVVELTIAEYETVRAEPHHFFLLPGHELEVDDVIERHDKYWVVAKHGRGAEIAEAENPRGDG